MNQKDLTEYIKMFDKVHGVGNYVLVFAKDFLARHRYDVRYQPKGCAIVWDENGEPEFICYYDSVVHPAEFFKKP